MITSTEGVDSDAPTVILADTRRHGLNLIAEPSGRVYPNVPPEAVARLPVALVEAMEANWPALRHLATAEPSVNLEETDPPNPGRKRGSLERWQNLLGDWHCQICDTPRRGMKLLD